MKKNMGFQSFAAVLGLLILFAGCADRTPGVEDKTDAGNNIINLRKVMTKETPIMEIGGYERIWRKAAIRAII